MQGFELTPKQQEAQEVVAGDATHIALIGGSRSGKTFLHTRNVVVRALKAPRSRHAILRFRFNHVKSSIVLDTFPKVMHTAFPGIEYDIDKTDWYATLGDGSQIWFGGLDDKERTEKILGQEYATVYLNECSQIPFSSREMAITRLAQKVSMRIDGMPETFLKPRMYYDLNPTNKAHWTYKLFIEKRDPVTNKPLDEPDDYASFRLNPQDNIQNLSDGYLKTLEGLSPALRQRFLLGEYAESNPNALFSDVDIEKWRVTDGKTPEMIRVVVAVDPSGSGDTDNADNDAIGIVVAGLGLDGNAYILEDCTVKCGPATWGRIAVEAYERHEADVLVGENNYGGEMVRFTIQTANRRVNYKAVNATRGKTVRAEPISALYDQGKVRHVGYLNDLENELYGFSTVGYIGEKSPNRADAAIWAITELFPSVVSGGKKKFEPIKYRDVGIV